MRRVRSYFGLEKRVQDIEEVKEPRQMLATRGQEGGRGQDAQDIFRKAHRMSVLPPVGPGTDGGAAIISKRCVGGNN